jgi:hypothetical protein
MLFILWVNMIVTLERSFIRRGVFLFLLCLAFWTSVLQPLPAAEPRIINIYNFVRDNDYRLPNSKAVLYEATVHQIQLIKKTGLPATFALQYDALMDTNYQRLFRRQLPTNCEIGAWWEIPRELAERAGLKWRGDHEWDPAANVGFSPGYTPAQRRKLVDVYMADFKAIFGYYPKTVGSWYIDEVTLAYMAKRYGVIASCNCKDQIGTDFYTLWGGYWNQAYYPSRVNAYMPAQTEAGQIDVPIFRMLGSDPIYQHGTTPGLISLEPVYRNGGGGMPGWVDWFMDNLIHQPCLAFAYAQAGQENSFGWNAMKNGLTYQVKLFARLAKAGQIKVETLEQAGKWFRKNFSVTPATSVVALDDWKHEGHKTVWYDSRFYRLNILWNRDSFFVRDIHCFDQNIVSPTHDTPLKATSLTYETLPIVDWAFWSDSGRHRAGMFPVLVSSDGATSPMRPEGVPVVKKLNSSDLSIVQALKGGGTFSIVCAVKAVICSGMDAQGKPLNWAWKIVGGEHLGAIVEKVNTESVVYSHSGVDYRLKLGVREGSCRRFDDGSIQLMPNNAGKLVLELDSLSVTAIVKRQMPQHSPK